MTRIDKRSFELRESLFREALEDELLTPTSFAAAFPNGPDQNTSALFADLARRLVPDDVENGLTPAARALFDDVRASQQSADFMNDLLGRDPQEVNEKAVYQLGLLARSQSSISKLGTVLLEQSAAAVEAAQAAAVEAGGESIGSFYGIAGQQARGNPVAGLAQLGITSTELVPGLNVNGMGELRAKKN